MTRIAVWILSVGLVLLDASVVSAQNYPSKPIRLVAGGIGSGTDFSARLIAEAISPPLGQPVIVDNRGSTQSITGDIVSRAQPDGYTLLAIGVDLWIGPLLEKTPYDPVKDFSPITITDRSPAVVVVNPSLPAKSIQELIALAKARPGALNYGSGSTGSTPHLAAELFKSMAGINIVRVPYQSFGMAVNDLIEGRIQIAFPNPNPVIAHIKSGKLRILAVTTAESSTLFPGVPTVAASGLPGYEYSSVTSVFAPAKTPTAIIGRLNQEIVRVLNRADTQEKILRTGSEAVGSSPDELAAFMKSSMARMSKIIKDAGIKAN